MKKFITITLILFLLLLPSTALADTTYFEENFDSYTAGFFPPSFTGQLTPPALSIIAFHDATNMFYFICIDNGPFSNGSAKSTAAFVPYNNETQLTLTFTYKHEIVDGQIVIDFGIPENYISHSMNYDGSISRGLAGDIAPPGTLVIGEYYNIIIVMDLINHTADYFLNSTQYGFDVPCYLPGNDHGSVFSITVMDRVPTDAVGAEGYFDDITIVGLSDAPDPEPTPAPNPRTGETGTYSFVYAIISVFVLVIFGFLLKRKAVANEK